jgi:hypothetical protein
MISPAFSPPEAGEAEALLGASLAAADAAVAGVLPILSRLLGPIDAALLSDRILAQTRAQLEDLARQLAGERAGADELAEALIADPAVLGHAHALALEAQLGERLADRLGLDPVAPPLVQALIASPDPDAAANAMTLLAAQARFGQWHRRGELPLAELPGFLRDRALLAAKTPRRERSSDEPAGRLELLERVVLGLGDAAPAALDLTQAGVGLFVTALALGAGLDRDIAVLATAPSQAPRLALALLACGLEAAAVEQQLLALHPDLAWPEGLDALDPARAAALLAAR